MPTPESLASSSTPQAITPQVITPQTAESNPRKLWLTPLPLEKVEQIVKLDQQCLGGLWTASGYQREIDSPNSDLLILESQAPGTHQRHPIGVGCLWAILEEGHITLLGIDPALHRQGLGQLVLWRLLTCARQRGLEWATLEVRVSNQAAISLYRKLGFQTVGERKNYYSDGETALILWRKGLQTEKSQTQLINFYQECCDRLRRFNWQLMNLEIPPD